MKESILFQCIYLYIFIYVLHTLLPVFFFWLDSIQLLQHIKHYDTAANHSFHMHVLQVINNLGNRLKILFLSSSGQNIVSSRWLEECLWVNSNCFYKTFWVFRTSLVIYLLVKLMVTQRCVNQCSASYSENVIHYPAIRYVKGASKQLQSLQMFHLLLLSLWFNKQPANSLEVFTDYQTGSLMLAPVAAWITGSLCIVPSFSTPVTKKTQQHLYQPSIKLLVRWQTSQPAF